MSRQRTFSADPLRDLWRNLGAEGAALEHIDLQGPATVLPSTFRVTEAAVTAVAAATLATAASGKRCALANLCDPNDRAAVEELLETADVLVQGYRPGALDALGFGQGALRRRHPHLIVAALSAYGDAGPWGGRRGFDSLVQMVSGIADEGMRTARADAPIPLPVQALDHATGYLLACGIAHGLQQRDRSGRGGFVRVALGRTAQWLDGLGRDPTGLSAAWPSADASKPMHRSRCSRRSSHRSA